MTAIIASTVGVKTMADDTLRLTIDIDPRYAGEAFALFGKRGSACAIARLTNEAAVEDMRADPKPVEEKLKGGALARLAGQLCQLSDFLEWYGCDSAEEAAAHIRFACGIESRAELDHNKDAAQIFHEAIRLPFLESQRMAA
jgi:hypothetical protein